MFFALQRFFIILFCLISYVRTTSEPTGYTEFTSETSPASSSGSVYTSVSTVTLGTSAQQTTAALGTNTQQTTTAPGTNAQQTTSAPGTNAQQTTSAPGTNTHQPEISETTNTDNGMTDATDEPSGMTNNPTVKPSPADSTGITPVVPENSTKPPLERQRKYSFTVGSNDTLKIGEIKDQNTLTNANNKVSGLFNTTVVDVSLIYMNISSLSRAMYAKQFTVFLGLLLKSKQIDCDESCIGRSQIGSNITSIDLPLENGTLVSTNLLTLLSEIGVETTTIERRIGESSPGLAARLGMGLGISFLGVLLIGEIAFFIWKSKSGTSGRSSTYAYAD